MPRREKTPVDSDLSASSMIDVTLPGFNRKNDAMDNASRGKIAFVDALVWSITYFAILLLGTWAVIVQIGVQLDITFPQVRSLLPVCFLAALGGAFWFVRGEARRILLSGAAPASDAPIAEADRSTPAKGIVQFAIAAGALLVALSVAFVTKPVAQNLAMNLAFFAVLLSVLGWGLATQWRLDGRAVPHAGTPYLHNTYPVATLAVLVLATLVPLFTHRFDHDDSAFLNIAAGMIGDPRPILTWDTILGDPNQTIMLPSYRVEVIFAFWAALANITGLEVIEVAHLVWPAFAALVSAAAYCLFAREVAGREWLIAFLASLAFLLVFAGVHHSFGNFSFVRFQQGKSLLFIAIVPLIYLFAVRFWRDGNWRDFAALTLTQAAGTGLSANGVYLSVIALIIVALGLLLTDPARIGRFILLGFSGIWPVCAGLIILLTTGAFSSEIMRTPSVIESIADVFGWVQAYVVVPLILAGWALFRGWTARFYLGCVLAFTLLVLNPLLNPLFADNVTGNLNWRMFFALPAPLFAGLAIARLWTRLREAYPVRIRDETAGLLLLAIAAVGPASIFWQSSVSFAPFQLDVDEDYPIAHALDAKLRPNSVVLAPGEISTWLSTMPDPKALVATRRVYLVHYGHTRPQADIDLRISAADFVTYGAPIDIRVPAAIERYVEYFGITDIIMKQDNPLFVDARAELLRGGWREAAHVEDYVLFVRPQDR